jgi:hypothetical protein
MVRESESNSWAVSGLPCRKYSSIGALTDMKLAIERLIWIESISMIHESAVLHYDSCRAQEISRVSALSMIRWSVCLYIASESFIEARRRSVWERLPPD